MSDFIFELHSKQWQAWELLTNNDKLDLLYGGAKGGGKTKLFCIWCFYWANWLIEFFEIKNRLEYPLPVGWIGRLRGVDFNTTTLETWKRTIPTKAYTIRNKPSEIIIQDRVKILYGGLDNQESIEKFNSAEFAFIGLDQGEEVDQDDVSTLLASLRLKFNGKEPPYKVLFTANPRAGYLKKVFISDPQPACYFIQALPKDNPFLAKDYEKDLVKRYGHNPALLKAYKDGDWDTFAGSFFEIFSRKYCVYQEGEIEILPSWPRFRSVDWGFSSPMAVYWHAVGPDGHVYTYREWYKTGMLDIDASKEVNAITEKASEKIVFSVGDPQSFPVKIPHFKYGKTSSIKRSDVWSENGVPLIMGDSDRVNGWSRMLQYMKPRPYANGISSYWHISSECVNLIDEIVSAVRDKNNVEDVSANSVDHGLESCRLFLMSQKPKFLEHKKQISMYEAAERQMKREIELYGEDF